ncbi:MAG: hypothetical protein GKR91_14920 [Pseudomonadales bacterium]|nr:hypothetical protein [Pseudomonadales bacterium]
MKCFSCGNSNQSQVEDLYGYPVCESCKPSLGLYKDHTIRKHITDFEKKRESVPENPTYAQEVDFRVNAMEERYIRSRLQLLHIQARVKELAED